MIISQFENIRVVLAEPDPDLLKTFTQCLQQHGFRSILSTGNFSQMVNVVSEGNVDLLIANTSLAGGDLNEYVTELRHSRHGINPFLLVITLLNSPSRDAVQAAIDSGTDHILAKPFPQSALIDSVRQLTHTRKRFVVTTDYIGPDRRSGHRPGTLAIPQIDVPNALRQRMTGQMSEGVLRHHVDVAKGRINEQKVIRHAFQIGWLLERLLPEIHVTSKSDEFKAHMQRLGSVAEDMSLRIKSTRYAHVASMCMTLKSMVDAATKDFDEYSVRMLQKIVELITGAFDPEREEQGANYIRDKQLHVSDAERGGGHAISQATVDKIFESACAPAL
ncbi:MAG: response regulator [Rhodospirillales bacterium]|nr:response regulator [Rhodospirillales bacterium]